MDQREREDDHLEAMNAMLDGFQARVWTSMPGIIQSYDPSKLTCTVQLSVQGRFQNNQGAWSDVTIPILVDCPLLICGGGGFFATFPIAEGDECKVFFASRCIDAWWQNGGVQPQGRYRMHDLSDGFVFVGPHSQTNLIANVSATSAQLRNTAGDTYVEIAPSQKANIVAPGGISLNGVQINAAGNVTLPSGAGLTAATGTVSAENVTGTSQVTIGSKPLSAHTHSGVQTGSGDTGPPV